MGKNISLSDAEFALISTILSKNNTEAAQPASPTKTRKNIISAEWKICSAAKRKFMSLPQSLRNTTNKVQCIEDVLNRSTEIIDSTRWWTWLEQEKTNLTRVFDFENYCKELNLEPEYVAEHLVFEGKKVTNYIRMNGLKMYDSTNCPFEKKANIRMFTEALYDDKFHFFGKKEVAHE